MTIGERQVRKVPESLNPPDGCRSEKQDGECQQYPSRGAGTNTQKKAAWQAEQYTKQHPQPSRRIHVSRAKGASGVVVPIWPCGLVPSKEPIISGKGAALLPPRQPPDLVPPWRICRVHTRTTHWRLTDFSWHQINFSLLSTVASLCKSPRHQLRG